MLIISDGKGRGSQLGVNKQNKALVIAESNNSAHYVAVDSGLSFNFPSVYSSATAGEYPLYIKNTDTNRWLFIDLCRVGGANAALWKVWGVTGTAAGGSAVTATNMNRGSGQTADATVRGDGSVTGLTTADFIASARHPADTSVDIPFDDVLMLQTDDAIAIEYDTGTTGAVEVLVRGYFLDPAGEV